MLGRWWVCILGGATALIVLLAGVPSFSGAASSAAGCPHGDAVARVNGRRQCMPIVTRRSGSPAGVARSLDGIFIDAERTVLAHAGRRAHRAFRAAFKLLRARLPSIVPGLLKRAAGAAIATHARSDLSEPVITPIAPGPGEVGGVQTVQTPEAQASFGPFKIRFTVTTTKAAFVDACPLAGGDDPGHGTFSLQVALHISGLGLKSDIDLGVDAHVRISGHVHSDAKLANYDLDLRATAGAITRSTFLGLRIDTGHFGPIQIHVVILHVVPRTARLDALGAFNITGPAADLAPLKTIPHLEEGVQRVTLYYVQDGIDDAVLKAQDNYYTNAACLNATVNPDHRGGAEPGSKQQVAVTVIDTADAQRVAMSVKAQPDGIGGASVSPTQAQTTRTEPASFTVTLPKKPGVAGNVAFGGTSDRGRLPDSAHNGREATFTYMTAGSFIYTVTMNGSGTYGEHEAIVSGTDFTSLDWNDSFTFSNTWNFVVLSAEGPPSVPTHAANSAHLTGTAGSSGSHHDGSASSFSCSDALADTNSMFAASKILLQLAAPTQSGIPVSAAGIYNLRAQVPTTGSCTSTGSYWSPPSASATGDGDPDVAPAMVGTATIPTTKIGQPSFTIPLRVPSLPAACSHPQSTGETCTHSLSWSASLSFNKTG